MHGRLLALIAAVSCAAVVSCSQGPSGNDGDCNARLRLHGDAYRPVDVLHTPHRDERIGTGTYLDCEGEPAPGLGDAQVFAIPGQDSSQLVIVAGEKRDGVYLAEAIPWRERPQLVKDSEHYLKCSGPVRFTGVWRYVEPDDMPNGEDYGSAQVPYTANFSTRKGTRLPLDRWSEVTLQAEITSDTKPVPSAQFLERATSGDVPVTVTATCHGESFHVETIRFAR